MIRLDSEQQIDLSVLEMEDIADRDMMQSFMENYSLSEGVNVTVVSRNADIRMNAHAAGASGDIDEDTIKDVLRTITETMKTYSGFNSDSTHIFAVPIIVKQHVLGAVICRADDDANRNIDAAITVLEIFVSAVVEAGYTRVGVEALAAQLAENFIQVSATLEELALSAQNITEQQQSLGEDISKIESVTSEIADITGSINKLADKTMMLGLNASIEAARLGNDGRGFAVVATQIRELSDSSRKTSEDIKNLNNQINEYVVSTIANSRESLKTTEDQSAAMQELSATIQTMVSVAQLLKEMQM